MLSATSRAQTTPLRMKVTIKKWHAVATWRWDKPEDETCGICRVAFDGTCPTCKYPGDDCSLLVGKCNHSFHMVRSIARETELRSLTQCSTVS